MPLIAAVDADIFGGARYYNAEINQATHAELYQTVDLYEGQQQYPAERRLSRQVLMGNTPPVAKVAMFRG